MRAGSGTDVEKIDLRIDENHTVALKSLGSAGYRWSATIDNPMILQVERLPSIRGLEQFRLTGLSAGETIVHFVQARSFEPGKPPRSLHDIAVRVTN